MFYKEEFLPHNKVEEIIVSYFVYISIVYKDDGYQTKPYKIGWIGMILLE